MSDTPWMLENVFTYIPFFTVSIMSIPVYFINKYVPFVLGKTKKRKEEAEIQNICSMTINADSFTFNYCFNDGNTQEFS